MSRKRRQKNISMTEKLEAEKITVTEPAVRIGLLTISFFVMLSDVNECTAIAMCVYIINIIIDICFSDIKLEPKLSIIAVNGLAVIICVLVIIGKITESGSVFRISENAMVFANLGISKYYFLILMFLDIGVPLITYISKKNRDK